MNFFTFEVLSVKIYSKLNQRLIYYLRFFICPNGCSDQLLFSVYSSTWDVQLWYNILILTWLLAGRLLGSPDSFPQEHLTVWPTTSVLCTATIACAADSLVENLIRTKREKKLVLVLHTNTYIHIHNKHKPRLRRSLSGAHCDRNVWLNLFINLYNIYIPNLEMDFWNLLDHMFETKVTRMCSKTIFWTLGIFL